MSAANVRSHYGINESPFFYEENEATIIRSVKVNIPSR